jgi:hypothetical protein
VFIAGKLYNVRDIRAIIRMPYQATAVMSPMRPNPARWAEEVMLLVLS